MRYGKVIVALLALVGVAQAQLDSSQTRALAEANKLLDQAEANLKVAREGMGNPPVSASKAKLTLTRLAQVKAAIQQADARLDKLPAGEKVDPVKQRSASVAADVKKLEDALTAPKDAAPRDDTAPKPPAGNAKLDYRQQEALKNARFHTDDVTGKAAALAELASTVKKAEDPNTIPFRKMNAGINTLDDARRKIKNATDHLASLPENGAGVSEVATDLSAAIASVDASEKILRPAYDTLGKALDPASHPTIDADLKRLSELAQMYADPTLLQSDRARAAARVTEIEQAKKERDRITKAYALLMLQETEAGLRFTGVSKHFDEKLAAFQSAAKEQHAALPGQIDADLAEAQKLAKDAAETKAMAFFANGIPDKMDQAKQKLTLLAALDPEASKAVSEKIGVTTRQLAALQGELHNDIIRANELPPDRFQGADRAKLEQLATDAWKKEQPDAQVLMVRIPSQNWSRDTLWRYQNGWYLIDRSRLQVQLLVKQDDTLATIRPVNLWIDHANNDELKAIPMDGKADALEPQRFVQLEKVK